MRVMQLGVAVAVGCMMVASAQALEVGGMNIDSRAEAGLEYRFISGDGDSAPGIYADYEIDLPEPMSLVVGVGYYNGDFDYKGYSGSYDAFSLELLLRIHWEIDQWRPYVGAGGAQYINSFDHINFSDKLGLIAEGGTYYRITDTMRLNFALRYATLQPHNVDPAIGTMNLDAFVMRAGLVWDL